MYKRERKPLLLPLISFETGGKTQTQPSGQPDQLHQQMKVCFYPRIETAAERPTRRADEEFVHVLRLQNLPHDYTFYIPNPADHLFLAKISSVLKNS